MAPTRVEIALRGRFVFPVSGPPIADGCVTLGDGRIVAVGRPVAGCPVLDLENVAIVPGLVNAHTHLEFSDLTAPLGAPGMRFPDWIPLVVAHRRAATAAPWASIEHGLRESLRSGTTSLGEIATTDWRPFAVEGGRPLPELVMFREALALDREAFDRTASVASEFLAAAATQSTIRPGLSPHAPYTVPLPLLARLVELARCFGVPLAMHLAESREELEWIKSGSGPFREILGEGGAAKSREGHPASILEYLDLLAGASRALVVHGNYLATEELEFVAARAATMAVVYCPRTQAFFGHQSYPLVHMLEMGVPVALGTDSRASNPDLSVLAEMQFVAARHPDVSAARVLELGTLAGAKALGLDEIMGTLEPGKLANLAAIQLGADDMPDPHEQLLAPAAKVTQTWLRGQRIV